MFDWTAALRALNVGMDFTEKAMPFLSAIDPPVAMFIMACLKGARVVEDELGLTPAGLMAPDPSVGVPFHPTALAVVTTRVKGDTTRVKGDD